MTKGLNHYSLNQIYKMEYKELVRAIETTLFDAWDSKESYEYLLSNREGHSCIHSGKSEEELARRLINNKSISGASCFETPEDAQDKIVCALLEKKNEIAKYTAYRLELPYAYLNFSYLIESYMGKTAQNLQRVFDYCKGQKCVLMLDEIDCIGLSRGNDTGADGELGRTTIALMQALDSLVDGQIVIAATNRQDRLDKALLRRFQRHVQFKMYEQDEEIQMIRTYMESVDISFLTNEILAYADSQHTQADTVKFLIEKIVEKVAK